MSEDLKAVRLCTRKEAAEALKLSERTLYTLDKQGALRAIRCGGAVRYRVSDIQAYLSSLATASTLSN